MLFTRYYSGHDREKALPRLQERTGVSLDVFFVFGAFFRRIDGGKGVD